MLLLTIGIKEVAEAFALMVLLAALAGGFWYTFRAQRTKVKGDAAREKADAAKEWREVADAHAATLELLKAGLEKCKGEHALCEQKINLITMFNLRLQARETRYQKTINRLESKLGLEQTDFLDVTAEDSAFG